MEQGQKIKNETKKKVKYFLFGNYNIIFKKIYSPYEKYYLTVLCSQGDH